VFLTHVTLNIKYLYILGIEDQLKTKEFCGILEREPKSQINICIMSGD